jgi:hypothetical protein
VQSQWKGENDLTDGTCAGKLDIHRKKSALDTYQYLTPYTKLTQYDPYT